LFYAWKWVCVLAILGACASSPEAELHRLRDRAVAAYERDEFERAATAVQQIDRVQGARLADAEMASLYAIQARAYWELGRDPEAEVALEKSIALYERSSGRDDLAIAPSLRLSAGLLREWRRYDEAIATLQRYIRIRHDHFGENDPEAGVAFFDLAGMYSSLDDRPNAESAYARSIAVLEQAGPEYQEQLIRAMVTYAQYIRNTEKSDEILDLMQRLHEISPGAWRDIH